MFRAVFVVLSLATISGCYWLGDHGLDVKAQAQHDLGCEHVEVRRVGSTGSHGHCSAADYVVEGCGEIAHYRCTTSCDYDCANLGQNDLRGN